MYHSVPEGYADGLWWPVIQVIQDLSVFWMEQSGFLVHQVGKFIWSFIFIDRVVDKNILQSKGHQ